MNVKAILTGHSRGLGAAIAAELLSRNIAVLALSRHQHAALSQSYPDLLQEVTFDLADAGALSAWLEDGVLTRFLADSDTVLLINNAGSVQPIGSPGMQNSASISQSIALNVAAPLMLSAAFVAASGHAGDRRIVHVSSGAARAAYSGWSVYCASKAALDHHARAVALDGVPGLRICSLAPGVVDTAMQAEIRASTEQQFPLREKFIALKRESRLISPERCARSLVGHLLSPHFGAEPIADLREVDASA
jgi:benzil reductase ((S)-benzoin forming)